MSNLRFGTVRLTATLVVLVALSCTLAGCGQKGKLFLPNQKKQVPPTTQSDSPPQPDTQAQPQPPP